MNVMSWHQAITQCMHAGHAYVIATVVNTQGSTPRDGGSKMVITADQTYDTIGGGRFELLVTQRARELLAAGQGCQRLEPFPLGAQAAQCCGGNLTVMLECIPCRDWQVAVFGAGHVGQALLGILAGLPCQVTVVDSRPELAPESMPPNARMAIDDNPVSALDTLPDNTWVIVLTHDHGLDFSLCCRLLTDYRWSFTGLIGSRTKAERFRARLSREGFSGEAIRRIQCPIGLEGVEGKYPMEVAVSIAAQLQSLYYQRHERPTGVSTTWREIKSVLNGEQME
ncbi:xanthine dehydrogenase accessory protein XdhC [Halomonas sp. 22501_18_FS]|uniref:Xanthine dehydrogenase accessory protein XdhC n=2 Tax=Oceanospirillales TaxID=135619 RepID=A0A9X5B791_9GAMM|nr:xanthine dehydrogenase accessory protein XdhC [Halomonas utahensis]MYL75038.1 xanthine dehydrogenase accessory protein XdhC [Halomonas sp. 22501_18_FS]